MLDKEMGRAAHVVELQGLKEQQTSQMPMAPAEPGLSPFPVSPKLASPSSYIHWSEGDTATALD